MQPWGKAGVRASLVLVGLLFSAHRTAAEQRPASAAVQGASPQVAFTFDDLPAHGPLPPGVARPEPVRRILQALREAQMPPVYGFINGFRVARYPYQIHILQAWTAAGQPLGNHTWSHPELDKTTARQYEAEIARNEPMLKRLEPEGHWRWFRYPFLEEGNTVQKREKVRAWLTRHDYQVAEVSMDFQDYLWNEPYARCAAQKNEAALQQLHDSYLATADEYIGVFRKLARELYGRDVPYVLLLHVGAFDAHMMPELIALFRSRGFVFVPLEQAMADPVYRQDPRLPSPGGATFLELIATERKAEIPDAKEPEAFLDHLCR